MAAPADLTTPQLLDRPAPPAGLSRQGRVPRCGRSRRGGDRTICCRRWPADPGPRRGTDVAAAGIRAEGQALGAHPRAGRRCAGGMVRRPDRRRRLTRSCLVRDWLGRRRRHCLERGRSASVNWPAATWPVTGRPATGISPGGRASRSAMPGAGLPRSPASSSNVPTAWPRSSTARRAGRPPAPTVTRAASTRRCTAGGHEPRSSRTRSDWSPTNGIFRPFAMVNGQAVADWSLIRDAVSRHRSNRSPPRSSGPRYRWRGRPRVPR